MGSTAGHRHTKPLGTAHGNIRTQLTDGCHQHLGERIHRHRHQSPVVVGLVDHRRGIPQTSATARELKQNAEHIVIPAEGPRLLQLDGHAKGLRPGLQHRQGLGQHRGIHQETTCIRAFADTKTEAHGLSTGRCLIQKRCVGDGKAGQLTDQGLEIEQCFEPSLGDLCLIGGVGGVPGGVLQNMALDQCWRRRVVITQADQRTFHLVEAPDASEFGEGLSLPAARGHGIRRRLRIPNGSGHNSVQKGIEISETQGGQHRLLIRLTGPDVALNKGRKLDRSPLHGERLFELSQVALAKQGNSKKSSSGRGHLGGVSGRSHQLVQLAGIGGTHRQQPALAMGIVLELFRACQHRLVALHDLAAHGGIHLLNGLDGFNGPETAAPAEAATHFRQIHEDDVTELINSEGAQTDAHQFTLRMGVFMAVGVAELLREIEGHGAGDGHTPHPVWGSSTSPAAWSAASARTRAKSTWARWVPPCT